MGRQFKHCWDINLITANAVIEAIEMEENRYYKPEKEDIRIGYECEGGFSKTLMEPMQTKWVNVMVDQSNINVVLRDRALLRTPYLTKEQIEAEGWTPINTGGVETGCIDGRCSFRKGNFFIDTYKDGDTQLYNIGRGDYYQMIYRAYVGECPSINEFRIICKLLKI